ncbi:MAG: TIGR00303 family protein [Methanomicrobiales archaeon]|nr:TIGR00303 family protein [Methanomicrobiales archaeon]MDD1654081.1 TIGR00303 family protein [Methanomicrobiales archaeon]
MPFLSRVPEIRCERPLFSIILGNTRLSTVPGVSGAGPTPERTLDTPVLDSELIATGTIRSRPHKPNTPTGCPTPAVITRAMMDLLGMDALFVNAGLVHPPVVPCLDLYGDPGGDPRVGDAVPRAQEIFSRGQQAGQLLSGLSGLLILGECVPGGTTTALCVLRGLGHPAQVSSSFVRNPVALKEEICRHVQETIRSRNLTDPLDVVRVGGDPMIAAAAGILSTYRGQVILAGGTQMLAVSAVAGRMGIRVPPVATTVYVRDDPGAGFEGTAGRLGVRVYYVDPGFGDIGHRGLARYCEGEVKEGIGAGGAMLLATLLGKSPQEIRAKILSTVTSFS